MAYHEMREYDCVADYYDAGNLGSRSPASIRNQRAWEARDRADERERTYQEMKRNYELTGG